MTNIIKSIPAWLLGAAILIATATDAFAATGTGVVYGLLRLLG